DACSIVIVVSTSGPRLQSTLFPTRRSSDLPRLSLDVNHDCRLDLYIPVRALVGEGDRRWLAAGSRIRAPHVLGRKVTVIRIRCKDRKSTRLNSSHVKISYAVFCLKKKKKRH